MRTWLPGSLLADPAWLADRVADAARAWRHDDRRVAATLWWFSVSANLLEGPAAALLAGRPVDPRPAAFEVTLRTDRWVGYVEQVRHRERLAGGPAAFGAALVEGFAPIVAGLGAAGAGNPRALWSVAADSLASRLLVAGGPGDPDGLAALAAIVAGDGPLPRPRYGRAGRRVFVRRGSCCLVLQVPGLQRCDNCPRQTPEQRQARVGGQPA
jgi:ferric iron reductase protein FhuF